MTTEEKKAVHTKKEEVTATSLMGLLLDVVVRSAQSFVDGAIDSVQQTAERITQKVTRRVFIFCFAFIGILFLLIGFAHLLDAIYHVPGLGMVVMGVFILTIVLIVSLFDRK